jgi:restriction system protein
MAAGKSSSKAGSGGGGWIAGVVVVVMILPGLVMQLAQDHPVIFTLIILAIVAGFAGAAYFKIDKRRRLAEYERNVAVTDGMSGTDFEHYMARLMRRSGFRRVTVSGKAGDMGCDVVGYTPDGRKVVVQCKRYSAKLTSPDVQRFAGTARDVHCAGVPLLVTTAQVTKPAREVAALCNITLVDRMVLSRWATTHMPPIEGWPKVKRQRLQSRTAAVPPAAAATTPAVVPSPTPAAVTPPSPVAGPPAAPVSRPPSADWWNDHTSP